VDGIKIGIIGLTTDEIVYKWRFEKGLVTNPFDSAQKYEQILKDRKNDVIIALTHIGLFNDTRMVTRSKYIDLVVGGHSHDALFKEKYVKNRLDKEIPIVQTGAHTKYLGRMIVDVEKGRPLKIVKYELIPSRSRAMNLQ
jgi:2',3'-cyclic-nucleotide 2'-phosphodiesterase (5'-nucleotidase family)